MKSLLLASLFIASSSVMAMPNIGDSVVLTGTAQGMSIQLKAELTGAAADKSSYTRLNTTTVNGASSEEVETVSKDDLVSEDTINTVLALCESDMIKGKFETITVPAGTFDTCKIESEGSIINMGMVPFGIVKVSSSEMSLSLESYKIAE